MNNRASDFLKNFEYSPEPVIDDIQKPKITPKMPAPLKKKMMDDYNNRVEEAKKKASTSVVCKTGNNILNSSFAMNDHYSYPYLFKYVTNKQITIGNLIDALKEKHDVIYNLVFDYAYENKQELGIDEDSEIFSFDYLFNEITFCHNNYIPGISVKEFYSELHKRCYYNPGIEILFHKVYLLINEFNKHYDNIKHEHIIEFIEHVFDSIQRATGLPYKLCIEPLIDLIKNHNILLNFTESGDISIRIKETFKKLLFEQNYEYTLKLQSCVYDSLKSYYKSLVELSKKEFCVVNDDGEEEEGLAIRSEEDLSEAFISLLIRLTQFENYNQIDFNLNPIQILQVMKGFISLGGYAYINIGFGSMSQEEIDSQNIENRGELRKSIQRVMNLLDEFKQSRKKISGRFTLLDFICTFKDYNSYAFELIDNNSPLVWMIASKNYYDMNLFESSVDKNNIDLAMKLIEKCDISKVISCFPLKHITLQNLVKSEHILQLLECIANNKDKIKDLIMSTPAEDQFIRGLPKRFEAVEKKLNNLELNENDYVEDSDPHNIVYAYYLKDAISKKLDCEIELFNLLFFKHSVYILDELVKSLKVSEIKELNKMGYIIGKTVSIF